MRVRDWRYVLLVLVLVGISLTVGAQQTPTSFQPAKVVTLGFQTLDDMTIDLATNVLYIVGCSGDKGFLAKYDTDLDLKRQISWDRTPYRVVVDSKSFVYVIMEDRKLLKFNPTNLEVVDEAVMEPLEEKSGCSGCMGTYEMGITANDDIYVFRYHGAGKPLCGRLRITRYNTDLEPQGSTSWDIEEGTLRSAGMAVDPTSSDVYVSGQIRKGDELCYFLKRFDGQLNKKQERDCLNSMSGTISGGGPQLAEPHMVADSGFVYIATYGKLPSGRGLDIWLEKFNSELSSAGCSSWGWQDPEADIAKGIAIDTATQDVYVVGVRILRGMLVIKYDNNVQPLWSKAWKVWGGRGSIPEAVVIDSSSNVYVGGDGFIFKL